MKQSVKTRRQLRHYRRHKKVGSLNLVSLMDIFTILVFFLMVNSSDVKVLDSRNTVDLPVSVAAGEPGEYLTISVTPEQISVGSRVITQLATLNAAESPIIFSLEEELRYQADRRQVNTAELAAGLPVTLLADKSLDYRILKRVMATSVAAGYSRISLATRREVNQAESVEPAGDVQ